MCWLIFVSVTCWPLQAKEISAPCLHNEEKVLLEAIIQGDIKNIQRLIDQGIDLNIPLSCVPGAFSFLEVAISNTDLLINDGNPVYHEVINELLEGGAVPDLQGLTNRKTGILNSQKLNARLLLAQNLKSKTKKYLRAIRLGRIEEVKKFVTKENINQITLFRVGMENYSPLQSAICFDYQEIFEFLLVNGAEINNVAPGTMRPLSLAIILDKLHLADRLLKMGASINYGLFGYNESVDYEKFKEFNPLEILLYTHFDFSDNTRAAQILDGLLLRGFNSNKIGSNGFPILYLLLNELDCSDPSEFKNNYQTYLKPIIKTLLENGCNPNLKGKDGRSPKMVISESHCPASEKTLLLNLFD